jgi:hypothetical protein
MYLKDREQYQTEILTREEYRKFGEYMTLHYPSVGHVVEKLDETFQGKARSYTANILGRDSSCIRDNEYVWA